MKLFICMFALIFTVSCKTTSDADPSPKPEPTEPTTAAQEPAADRPAEDPEPTTRPTKEESDEHPVTECCNGITFDEVESFPFTFTVSKKSAPIGEVTLDAKHQATFKAADGANGEYVAEIQALIDAANKDGEVTYKYSNRTPDTHCKCGGAALKSTPQYPGAFKHAIYSEYFEVSD